MADTHTHTHTVRNTTADRNNVLEGTAINAVNSH